MVSYTDPFVFVCFDLSTIFLSEISDKRVARPTPRLNIHTHLFNDSEKNKGWGQFSNVPGSTTWIVKDATKPFCTWYGFPILWVKVKLLSPITIRFVNLDFNFLYSRCTASGTGRVYGLFSEVCVSDCRDGLRGRPMGVGVVMFSRPVYMVGDIGLNICIGFFKRIETPVNTNLIFYVSNQVSDLFNLVPSGISNMVFQSCSFHLCMCMH